MKICAQCRQTFPDQASYCMHCGRPLVPSPDPAPDENRRVGGGWNLFLLTLGGSLLLSWFLIAVLGMPVLVLGAFLPLFWFSGRKQ